MHGEVNAVMSCKCLFFINTSRRMEGLNTYVVKGEWRGRRGGLGTRNGKKENESCMKN
jgi:hypothetical protein